jgi:putative phosphoesterase
MKLGILSDSHGRVAILRQALARLDAEGVDAVIHCGDIGGIDSIEELAGRRAWFVWGNTDSPQPRWQVHVEELDLAWPAGPLRLTLDDHVIGVFHGHERGFGQAVKSGEYDYIFYGHTHEQGDKRVGRTRLINPGALHRVAVRTVAVLDLASDSLQFLTIDPL